MLITLLRDENNDGTVDKRLTFIDNLTQPFGMLVLGDWFYVANTEALWRYPYLSGITTLDAKKGERILTLPAGKANRHWTRNIIAITEGSKFTLLLVQPVRC